MITRTTLVSLSKEVAVVIIAVSVMVPPKPAQAVIPALPLAAYIVPLALSSLLTYVLAKRDAELGGPMARQLSELTKDTLNNAAVMMGSVSPVWSRAFQDMELFSGGKRLVGEDGSSQVILSQDSSEKMRIARRLGVLPYTQPVIPDYPQGNAQILTRAEQRMALAVGGRVYGPENCMDTECAYLPSISTARFGQHEGSYFRYVYQGGGSILVMDTESQILELERQVLIWHNNEFPKKDELPINLSVRKDISLGEWIYIQGAMDGEFWSFRVGGKRWSSTTDLLKWNEVDASKEGADYGEHAKEAKLTDDSLALMTDTVWRKAAVLPGYTGVPYQADKPVSGSEIKEWREKNPALVPSIQDMASKAKRDDKRGVIFTPNPQDYIRRGPPPLPGHRTPPGNQTPPGDNTAPGDRNRPGDGTAPGDRNRPGDGSVPGNRTRPGDRTVPETHPGDRTIPGTLPGNRTIPGDRTVPGTLPGNRTIPGEKTVPGTLPGNRTIPADKTLPGNQTVPGDKTKPIDWGTPPPVNVPGLEPTPTAAMILAPLLRLFPGLRAWEAPSHYVECSRPVIEVFDKPIRMNAMCDLTEPNRGMIRSIMMAVFALGALLVVLSA